MIRFEPSRKGTLTASSNGTYLHSRYDPVREAERFVLDAIGEETDGCIILVGECLGYLHDALCRLRPNLRVIVFYLSDACRSRSCVRTAPDSPVWFPGSTLDPGTFLSCFLPESDIERLRIVNWQPGAIAFPERFRTVSERIVQTVREIAGSLSASRAFGRRWLSNAAANALFREEYLTVRPQGPGLIVIAASGPSLKESIPLLVELRARISLWALPSSIEALLHHGLVPDLTISTDPGYWAALHLRPLRRSPHPLAAPLTGTREAFRSAGPVLVLSQGTFPERSIIEMLGIPAVSCPENGTVAGSALQLALSLGAPSIVFTGLDFSFRDLHGHTEPHPFTPHLMFRASRLEPFHSIRFSRAFDQAPERSDGGVRTSPALRTYAGWFGRLPSPAAARIHRYRSSAVAVPGIRDINEIEFRRLASDLPAHAVGPGAFSRAESREAWSPIRLRSSFVERKSGILSLLQTWRMVFEMDPSKGRIDEEIGGIREGLRFLLLPGIREQGHDKPGEREAFSDTASFLSALYEKVASA